tara:strand:+ start:123 stop:443 length:321 start_codon:yes stop_codon:yes gene_type:complete
MSEIYSKIESERAINSKKNLLESQASLLRSLKHLDNYKILRKKELMLKIKLKKNVKEVKDNIKEILKNAPKTEHTKKVKEKAEESHVVLSIESELEDIQNKLRELG